MSKGRNNGDIVIFHRGALCFSFPLLIFAFIFTFYFYGDKVIIVLLYTIKGGDLREGHVKLPLTPYPWLGGLIFISYNALMIIMFASNPEMYTFFNFQRARVPPPPYASFTSLYQCQITLSAPNASFYTHAWPCYWRLWCSSYIAYVLTPSKWFREDDGLISFWNSRQDLSSRCWFC